MQIKEQLDLIVKRFDELQHLLGTPDVAANHKLYSNYARELSRLKPLVGKYQEYQNIEKQLKQAREILSKSTEADLKNLAEEEVNNLQKKFQGLKTELEDAVIQKDLESFDKLIVEIRAGTGGLEASIFVADLFRMYSRFAAARGFKLEMMSSSPTEAGGFKEAIFSLEGKEIYRHFKYESGVHRVQRVPATESSGRIHTSAVSVAVLPEPEEVDLEISPKDLKIDVYRSTGHGGQSVNTTDSAVRMTHLPTQIVVTCQDERSQIKNRVKAMRVLRARLLDKHNQEQRDKLDRKRKVQVGTGDRSEKIRTYNYPDRRVTDHRINLTLYKLQDVLNGNLDEFIASLWKAEREKRLKEWKQE